VDELEARLGKPVVTSNQAMVWQALRRLGAAPAKRCGRLISALEDA